MKMHLGALGVLATAALLVATAAAAPTRAGVAATHAGVEGYTGTIAFLRETGSTNTISQSLYVVHPDGSGLLRVTPPALPVAEYAWSPNGKQIAFIDARNHSLWLVRPDGTGLTQLLSGATLATYGLGWSPDGTEIAISSPGPYATPQTTPSSCTSLLYILPISGSAPRTLGKASATCDASDPAWSPQGSEIAYSKVGPGLKTGIWAIRPDGSKSRRISGHPGGPHWSPDGKLLAFNVPVHLRNGSIDRYRAFAVIDANGKHFHVVTRHAYNEYGEVWRPQGRRILYGRAHREGIYTIGSDGRNNRRVTRDSPPQSGWGALAWSPSGDSIVYGTKQTGNGDLYIVGADGRDKVHLTSTPEGDNSPSWVDPGRATSARPASQGPRLLPSHAGIVTSLALDPAHPDTVYVGTLLINGKRPAGGRVYKSIDGGNHWRLISRPAWPRISALAVDPERPRTVYVGTGKDLYKTTDGGRTWHAWHRGLLQPPGINRGEGWTDWLAVDPTNSKVIYEHDYANTLRKSTDGGHSWKVVLSAWEKTSGGMSALLMTPGHPPALYVAFSGLSGYGGPKGRKPGIYKSTDGARTWGRLGLPAPNWPADPNGAAAFAADPQQKAVYSAVGARIFASTNAGHDWRRISQGLPQDQYVTSLAAGGGTVFATFSGTEAIYKSADGGGTWTQSGPVSMSPGVGLTVDPARPTTVYAVSYTANGAQILRSINSGRTWTVIG